MTLDHNKVRENIPQHMWDAVILYFEFGIEPGGFFRAVLENDLIGAACRADSTNEQRLKDYALFLCNYVPGRSGDPEQDCWGSPAAVHNHLARYERLEEEVT
jgi:hypothetical protein